MAHRRCRVGAARRGIDVLKAADMELLTIRGYDEAIYMRYAQIGPKVFIRQTTQSTVRLVRKRE